jgi:hypothetical protein
MTPACLVCGHTGPGLNHYPSLQLSRPTNEMWLCDDRDACQQRQLANGQWVGSQRATTPNEKDDE